MARRVGAPRLPVRLRRRCCRSPPHAYAEMVAHAYDGLPLEACGLLAGAGHGQVTVFYPCRNTAASARIYTVDPQDHLGPTGTPSERGLELIGVMHSHTHTEAYPSPTDVAQAPDPSWHYVIVSLKREAPGPAATASSTGIAEEPVTVA